MSLAELIHKKRSVAVATAIPAIPATHAQELTGTVARIATVAVASPKEAETDGGNSSRSSNNSSSKPCERKTVHYRWLIHFSDRNPLEVAFSPAATHAEVLDTYPSALAAEPIEPCRRQPDALLGGDQKAAVLAWLTQIGETDQAIVAEVLAACRRDIDARRYFLERAESRLTNTNVADCANCRHRRSPGGTVRYCASGRSDLPLAYGDGHPLRRLPDDQGPYCNQWSGLIQEGVD